jgi:hypothetical protein
MTGRDTVQGPPALAIAAPLSRSFFREGWVLWGAGKRRVHYLVRSEHGFRARCGLKYGPGAFDDEGFVAVRLGRYPTCQRCDPPRFIWVSTPALRAVR